MDRILRCLKVPSQRMIQCLESLKLEELDCKLLSHYNVILDFRHVCSQVFKICLIHGDILLEEVENFGKESLLKVQLIIHVSGELN